MKNDSATTKTTCHAYGNQRTISTESSRKQRIKCVFDYRSDHTNRVQTLELIAIYAKIAPIDASLIPDSIPSDGDLPPALAASSTEEFDFASSLVLLSEPKQLDITSRFRRDADAYYVEAKRSTVSSVAQIPYWMYGVLVVLGWNEAMLVLFNPLYFAVLLGMLGAAYVARTIVAISHFL